MPPIGVFTESKDTTMKYSIFTLALIVFVGCAPVQTQQIDTPKTDSVRIATFNVSMYRQQQGQLIEALAADSDPQIMAVAKIIGEVNPDILLINEFDYDADGKALELFQQNYLTDSQSNYPFTYVVPSNTGVSSGVDLDNSGEIVSEPGAPGYGGDAFGFGNYQGQYGFAIVSRYPIDIDNIRSFRNFLWKDMPNNVMPTDWYSATAQERFRLSSKNHVDVPINIDGQVVHILATHPTPPTFDGPEDRNGKRNHDEIRLFADYITPNEAGYLVDDNGIKGGLVANARFVLMGDLNADPHDGDSYNNSIRQLIDHPKVNDTQPKSNGGPAAAEIARGGNTEHKSPASTDTSDFRDINDDGTNAVGNLRLDYVLPSKNLEVAGSGVYWPAEGEAGYDLVGPGFPPISSDHRMVWVDVVITTN
jgi:endonuclease/exonuclease/phosphatase family metal-dependent hydrolase